ncbi:MAG: fibrobacter succinogenes major paralogous domain-containing protein [Saprospiraceae bacterium]|nr:fibrobacter succinogenes major paralogous domain-containing protein [Saprospiraceae bacterium]
MTTGVAFEGEVEDFDGNIYRTVKIGGQIWMAENLRTEHFSESTPIPEVNNNSTWQSANFGAWCYYDTLESYNQPYGKLYNWFAVNDVRGLCPVGWHVPTATDWSSLTSFLGGAVNAGKKTKEVGNAHWLFENTDATNESGFTALPGGYRQSAGTFAELGYIGNWWSSTSTDMTNASYQVLWYPIGTWLFESLMQNNSIGNSVRCLKNP